MLTKKEIRKILIQESKPNLYTPFGFEKGLKPVQSNGRMYLFNKTTGLSIPINDKESIRFALYRAESKDWRPLHEWNFGRKIEMALVKAVIARKKMEGVI